MKKRTITHLALVALAVIAVSAAAVLLGAAAEVFLVFLFAIIGIVVFIIVAVPIWCMRQIKKKAYKGPILVISLSSAALLGSYLYNELCPAVNLHTDAESGYSGNVSAEAVDTAQNADTVRAVDSLQAAGSVQAPDTVQTAAAPDAVIPPNITWTATVNDSSFTTAIKILFSEPISELSADNFWFIDDETSHGIYMSGWISQTGIVTGDGRSWSLEVTVARAGPVTIVIKKPGVESGTEPEDFYLFRPDVKWTASAVGNPKTTHIRLNFEVPLRSFYVGDIEIFNGTGTAAVSEEDKTDLNGKKPAESMSWLVPVIVKKPGSIKISLSGPDFRGIEKGIKTLNVR